MSSKRRLKRVKERAARNYRLHQCGNKVPFHSPESAREFAQGATHRMGTLFEAYRCRICQCFHIGHARQDAS